jgi:hypothetical protein
MDIETLFVATKWEMLKEIAEIPSSPLQLSQRLGTTIANVSTQLRLLEAAKLVKRERTGSAKAGKPRYLFSFVRDTAHITSLANDLTYKQLITLQPHHKSTLSTWRMKKQHHGPVMKFLYMNDELFKKSVYVIAKDKQISIFVISSKKSSSEHAITFDDATYNISITKDPKYKPQTGHTQICYGEKI